MGRACAISAGAWTDWSPISPRGKHKAETVMGLDHRSLLAALCSLAVTAATQNRSTAQVVTIQNSELAIEASQTQGTYTIRTREQVPSSITAHAGAKIDGKWVVSTQY